MLLEPHELVYNIPEEKFYYIPCTELLQKIIRNPTLIRWEPLDHASQRVVDCDWAYSQGLAPLQDQLNAPPFVEQLRLPIKVVLLKKIERGSYKRLFLEMGWSGNARGKAGFSVERRSVGVR